MRCLSMYGALFVTLLSGCGLNLDPAADGGSRRAAAPVGGVTLEDPLAAPAQTAPLATPPESTTEAAATPAEANPPAESPSETTAETASPADTPAGETETVKAEAGVGKQGRYEGSGLIVTPLKAYFGVRQRIAFDSIAYNLKLYKAANDRFPKDFVEFKVEILEPLQIELPELPAGHRYVYDAKNGELQVERPRP